MTKNLANPEQPELWSYKTAPTAPALRALGVNERQLRRWVMQGKVTHHKIGHRVFFTDAHLAELVETLTVRAVR